MPNKRQKDRHAGRIPPTPLPPPPLTLPPSEWWGVKAMLRPPQMKMRLQMTWMHSHKAVMLHRRMPMPLAKQTNRRMAQC